MSIFHRTKTVEHSNILRGISDCHSHLLPGVDDGVDTFEESLEILDTMQRHGVKKIWLTPHIMEDIPNETSKLKSVFQELKSIYKGSIELNLAAEYMMDNLLEERLHNNDLLPLDEGRRYLLVETSYFNKPMEMVYMLKKIMAKGYFPLLAHPERFEYMQLSDYETIKSNNVFFQLNIPSLTGMYGKHVKAKAENLLKLGMYNLSGCDTHSITFYNSFLNSQIRNKDVIKMNENSFL